MAAGEPGPGTPPPGAPAPGPTHDLLTLPNIITFVRLLAVPATIWLILQKRLDLAFMVFVAAGLSDALDGWLARVMNARSQIGALLDPVADKALLVSVYVTLAAIQVLPDWLAILVVFRDVLIVGGLLLLWMVGQRPVIQPILLSKVNTALQIGLAALALFTAGFALPMALPLEVLVWLVAATTLASGVAYVAGAARRLKGLD
ncbi:MAG TPA: CDP-alcohol phosphatidyltransferase family protein [Roseococcus sp.]|nr:CDP-alcohol phosphatidyltransferase family protein [Roseococcus sp.]